MIDSVLDLIAEAASNSLFVFCFCNLIIVMIIVGSKPSEFRQDSEEIYSSIPVGKKKTSNLSAEGDLLQRKIRKKSMDSYLIHGSMKKFEEDGKEGRILEISMEEKGNNNEDEDDELRRKVEEFIDRVNREWKAELLRDVGAQ